jgi:hypothetical protein
MSEKTKSEEPPVHPSAGEVAEEGVRVLRDAATDAKGVVVHSGSQRPVKIGGKRGERKKERNAA